MGHIQRSAMMLLCVLSVANRIIVAQDSPTERNQSEWPDVEGPPGYVQHKTSDWQRHADLHRHILGGYHKDLRPVHNQTSVTTVGFQFHVTHVEDVRWRDENVDWRKYAPKFAEVASTRLQQYYLWAPDLVLFNNANAKESNLFGWGNTVTVKRNGTVLYDPQTRFTATCHFDFKQWPKDTQSCALYFGSWVYRYDEVRFVSIPVSNAVNSSPVSVWGSFRRYGAAWHIANARVSNRTMSFSNDMYGLGVQWQLVVVHLDLVRNAGYAGVFVIMPLNVAWTLCLLSFWTQGMTRLAILLVDIGIGMAHLGILVAVAPPATPARPNVFSLVELTSALVSVALLLAIMSNHWRRRSRNRPPPACLSKWLTSYCCRQIFKWLLCVEEEERAREYSIQLVDGNDGTDSTVNHVEKSPPSADWQRVARFFDFLCFLVYALIFCIAYARAFGSWLK